MQGVRRQGAGLGDVARGGKGYGIGRRQGFHGEIAHPVEGKVLESRPQGTAGIDVVVRHRQVAAATNLATAQIQVV